MILSPGGQTRRRLGGRQPLCGTGVTSWIEPTSRPAACGDRRGLAGALEADLAGGGPGDDGTGGVGDRDDGVVERALDVGVPVSDVLLFLATDLLRPGGTALGWHLALSLLR